MTTKEFKEVMLTIKRLVNDGYKIVVVEMNGAEGIDRSYFSVTKFEPASGGSDPVDYNFIEGVNITEFILKGLQVDDRGFKDLFDKFLDRQDNSIIKYKFHKNILWHWFTP